ncbi:ROK family protein [Frigidibacter sp. SD6-1]|uniref:ROK family transcriptional regulator n=1 Tax=Frigidibacter sp. SD6-1 TaxID=3032581 RepID=UPI0024DF910B|nr:ROK family protein [Frigidibacter sp. SD6-1]
MRLLSKNERRIVDLVYRNQGIARVDLAQAIDLTGASVTRLVSGLLDEKVLTETVQKEGDRKRGQPKKQLALQRERFCSAGFYILSESIEAVFINLTGEILAQRSIPWSNLSAAALIEVIGGTTAEFLANTKPKDQKFLGIGLGLPGNFGTARDQIKAHEVFPLLDGHAIQEALSRETDWDIYLENDGTAVALGEYLFGRHGVEYLFLLHIGYGLGGGAVLDGRPYRGAHGNACLPGALFPYDGHRPTLQDYEATLGLTGRRFRQQLAEGTLSAESEARADAWIARASTQIEQAVRLISGLFDPQLIVLGGALPTPIPERIALALNGRAIDGPSRGLTIPPVTASPLGDLNGPIGAASIPFFERFFPGSTALA